MSVEAADIVFASSHMPDPADAMAQVAHAMGDSPLAGMLLFCSHRFDRDALARAVNRHGEHRVAIGCTSSGELTEQGYDEDSLSVIGFPAAFAASTKGLSALGSTPTFPFKSFFNVIAWALRFKIHGDLVWHLNKGTSM